MEKKNNNKIAIGLALVLFAVVAFFGIEKLTSGDKVEGEKSVIVTIIDDTKKETLLDKEEFKTDATTLEEFLRENQEELKVDLQDSEYGAFVNGMYGLNTTDMANGPWIMYGFESPDQNIKYEVRQAPGVSDINLGKENVVTFEFTKGM